MFLPLKLLCTGKAVPPGIVSSSELDRRLGLAAGTVFDRSGVVQRHYAGAAQSQSALAADALRDAFARGDVDPGSIDLLLSAAAVPEQALPSTAARILDELELGAGTPGFDVDASCIGFLAALQVAAALLHAGAYRRIAIVASDLASRGLDFADPESSLILGDGAAAAIVERGDGRAGIRAARLQTWPEGKALCEIRAGGTRLTPDTGAVAADFKFRMNGKGVFRLASQVIEPFLDGLFREAGLAREDVDVIVPHQASHLAMKHVRKRLGLREDRVVDIYATHGNQVAASMPTALHEAATTGRLRPGAHALLLGSAAGLTIGGLVLAL